MLIHAPWLPPGISDGSVGFGQDALGGHERERGGLNTRAKRKDPDPHDPSRDSSLHGRPTSRPPTSTPCDKGWPLNGICDVGPLRVWPQRNPILMFRTSVSISAHLYAEIC